MAPSAHACPTIPRGSDRAADRRPSPWRGVTRQPVGPALDAAADRWAAETLKALTVDEKDDRQQVPPAIPQDAPVLYLSILDDPSGWRIAAPRRTCISELKKRWGAAVVRDAPAILLTCDLYDLPKAAAVRAIAGDAPIGGKLPISLPGMFPIGHGLERPAQVTASGKPSYARSFVRRTRINTDSGRRRAERDARLCLWVVALALAPGCTNGQGRPAEAGPVDAGSPAPTKCGAERCCGDPPQPC